MEYDDGSEAFKLRQELKNDSVNSDFDEPVSVGSEPLVWGKFGILDLIGCNMPTNDACGNWATRGCDDLESHAQVGKDGKIREGQVYYEHYKLCCWKPSCCICYPQWVVREAHRVEHKLLEVQRLHPELGKIEAGFIGVKGECLHTYGDYLASKKNAIKGLKERGVVAFALFPHPARYKNKVGYYSSFHWHWIGFLSPEYECRNCPNYPAGCFGCKGFEGRTRRVWNEDGYICKVFGERKSVYKTVSYELSHAGLIPDKKVFRIVTYVGFRALKVKVPVEVKPKRVCPHDGNTLHRFLYIGSKQFFDGDRLVEGRSQLGWDSAFEDGVKVWSVVVKDWFSGSSEREFVVRRRGS
jgi:hypothetical protein